MTITPLVFFGNGLGMTRAILIYFLRREGQRAWLPSHLPYRRYSSTSLEEKGRGHAYFPTFLLEEGWGLAWPPSSTSQGEKESNQRALQHLELQQLAGADLQG